MYTGRFFETGPAPAVLDRPWHPYTLGLRQAVVDIDDAGRPPRPIPGELPDPAPAAARAAASTRAVRGRTMPAATARSPLRRCRRPARPGHRLPALRVWSRRRERRLRRHARRPSRARDLHVSFGGARGGRTLAVDGRLADAARRRDARPRRRVRLAARRRSPARSPASCAGRRRGHARRAPAALPASANRATRGPARLPGPLRLAQPAPAHRQGPARAAARARDPRSATRRMRVASS